MHQNKPDKNLFSREKAQHVSRVRRISWIGLAVNLFLAVLKFTVGFLGNSQAVIADAVHSLSDMGTDLAVIFGVKYWSAPADEDHPYGHWRIFRDWLQLTLNHAGGAGSATRMDCTRGSGCLNRT